MTTSAQALRRAGGDTGSSGPPVPAAVLVNREHRQHLIALGVLVPRDERPALTPIAHSEPVLGLTDAERVAFAEQARAALALRLSDPAGAARREYAERRRLDNLPEEP